MKFKLLVSLAFGWFAMSAQAAVVADVALSSLAATRSSGDTFAAQAERSRVDSVASSAGDSVALPEPDLALLIAGVGVVGFLAARRRNR